MSANFTRRYGFCGGAQIIPTAPDFAQSYSVTFKANTAIIESLSGAEYRVGRYYRPLVTQNMTLMDVENATLKNYNSESGYEDFTEYLKNILKSRGNTPVGVPVWMDAVPLLQTIEPTADDRTQDPELYEYEVEDQTDNRVYDIIHAEAHGRLFPWFRYALLWTSAMDYEIVSIANIGYGANSTEIRLRTCKYYKLVNNEKTLTRNGYPFTLARAHNAGSLLVPLAFGYMKVPDVVYKNGRISSCTIQFQERQGLEPCNFYSETNACSAGYGETLLTQYVATKCVETNSSDTLSNTDFPFDNAEWSTSPKAGYIDSQDYEAQDSGVAKPYIAFTDYKNTYQLHFQGDRYLLQKLIRHFENRNGALENFKLQINANNGGAVQHYVADETNAASAVRYQTDDLKVTMRGNNFFSCDVGFIKDFLGQGYQQGSQTARKTYLYRFTKGYEAPGQKLECTKLFCDYGFALNESFVMDGTTYTADFVGADITHSALKHSDEMMGEEAEIIVRGEARESLMLEDEVPCDVEIYECSFGSPDTVQSVFRGKIVQKEIAMGGELTIKISSELRVMEREMPRYLLQRQCNHIFGDDLCGVPLAIPESDSEPCIIATATATFYNSGDVSLLIDENPDFTYDDVLRYGTESQYDSFWIGATILTEDGQRFVILEKTGGVAPAAQTFRLNKPFPNIVNGKVLLYPWCNHSIHHCRYKFNNVCNFGGCPWLPSNNALDNLKFNQSVGKK